MQENLTSAPLGAIRKNWEELTVEEKIKRTRDEVKTVKMRNMMLERSISKLRKLLSKHIHTEDGKVIEIKEITQYEQSEECGVSTNGIEQNKYF